MTDELVKVSAYKKKMNLVMTLTKGHFFRIRLTIEEKISASKR